jgi:hypothetical protein
MNENADLLQKRLEELEAGKQLEECQEGLDETEMELLQLAAQLREFEPPARNPSIVEKQLSKLKQGVPRNRFQTIVQTLDSFFQRSPWFTPAFAATALVVFGCLAASAFWGWTIFRLDQRDTDPARVQETQGIIEVQAKDGSWQPVKDKARLAPGSRVRTGMLSNAVLKLQDGTIVRLGSSTEITLDQMDRFLLGVRIVRITQWHGETNHEVQSNTKNNSLYEVRTPTSTVTAKGTAFSVQTQAGLLTRISVTEGLVDVTGAQETVSLEAGQTSSVAANQPPSEPALLVSGEGPLLRVSESLWTVAGESITIDPTTEVIGNPQIGNLVSFEGRQLADGTVLAEHLTVLMPPQPGTFTLAGELENIASTGLVLEGKFVAIDPQTVVSTDVENGEAIVTSGVILADGSWLATSVYSATSGQPIQFTGVVQSSQGNTWLISGSEIIIDENTVVHPNILTGDVVQVAGWIQKNGDWLAGSIQPAPATISRFDFMGTVDRLDPWVISGKAIQTRPWTLIDSTIQEDDLVHVQGPVLEDGTWVAASIVSANETPEDVSLQFTGIVNSTDPWVIGGIQLVVDGDTQFSGQITTGALVRVRATLQPDGVWHADEILLIVPDSAGCVTFAAVVTDMDGDQISLSNGMTINLNEVNEIDGTIEIESVVLVTRCLASDGTVTIPLIQVLSNPPEEVTPTPTTTPTLTSTPAPVSVILPNCYKITFLGFTDNGDGTSTWRYQVEELSCAQDLSNWLLELPACASVVDASPSPWEVVQTDPNFQLNGIKWQTGTGFERGDFSVTLSGDLTTGTVRVGAKGPDVAIGSITGPACDLPATGTPIATLIPTATADVTSTSTSLSTDVPPTVPPQLPTQVPPPADSGTILITDNAQTLTFTCNGNAVEVRGNANTITLLGSCSSITMKGNANEIYYSGSPVITDTGNANRIIQR